MSNKHVPTFPIRERLLAKAPELAGLMNLKRSAFQRLLSRGFLPAPITLPGSTTKYWRIPEVTDWINAGCPPRSAWEWRPRIGVDGVAFFAALSRLEERMSKLEKLLIARREYES